MPDNALAALAIQPAPSMLPALGQFTEMQRNANALQRENALYAALGAGNATEAARYDPAKANSLATFQRDQRAAKAFKEFGAGAAAGDEQSMTYLTVNAPEYAKVVSDVRQNSAQTLATLDKNTRDGISWGYPILGGALLEAAAESDPQKRLALLEPVIPVARQLGMPDPQIRQFLAGAVDGSIDLFQFGLGFSTAGAEAQKQIAQTAFSPTELKPGMVVPPGAATRIGIRPPAIPGPMPGPMPQATVPQPPAAPGAPGTPPAAPGATATPPAPAPLPGAPAPAGGVPLPARAGGFPITPTAGGGFEVPAGAAQNIKLQQDELFKTGSFANVADARNITAATSRAINALLEGVDLNRTDLDSPGTELWTGAGRSFALEAEKGLQGFFALFGMNNEALNVRISKAEEFRQGMNLMAAKLAKESLGYPMSNFDFSVFLQSMPGLDTSVRGNLQLLGVMDQYNQRNQAIAEMAAATSIRGGDWAMWRQQVDNYIAENPIVDPRTGRTISAPVGMGRISLGEPIRVTLDQIESGEVDKRFHLLPGAQIFITDAGVNRVMTYGGRPGSSYASGLPR